MGGSDSSGVQDLRSSAAQFFLAARPPHGTARGTRHPVEGRARPHRPDERAGQGVDEIMKTAVDGGYRDADREHGEDRRKPGQVAGASDRLRDRDRHVPGWKGGALLSRTSKGACNEPPSCWSADPRTSRYYHTSSSREACSCFPRTPFHLPRTSGALMAAPGLVLWRRRKVSIPSESSALRMNRCRTRRR